MLFVNTSINNENLSAKIQNQIYTALGKKPPVNIATTRDGRVYSIDISAIWREGSTTPVKNEDGTTTYEENYTEQSLTAEEMQRIRDYVANNYPVMVEQ